MTEKSQTTPSGYPGPRSDSDTDSKTSKWFWIIVLLVGPAGVSVVSLLLGPDVNWDLANYHFYNGYAFLNDRLTIDHHPAYHQTYLNPAIEIFTVYPLFRFMGPLGFAIAIGAIQGLAFVFLVLITLQLLRDKEAVSKNDKRFCAILAGILAFTGALVVSEIGSTMGDLTLSVLNLAAFYFLLKGTGQTNNRTQFHYYMLCCFTSGLCSGLKLPNCIYSVAFLFTLFVTTDKNRLKTVVLCSIALGVGFLVTHGWWSAWLWHHYGNPVFPYFNKLFKSPFFGQVQLYDHRFYPTNILETLFYPFIFSWGHRTSEIYFRDFRFPLAYVCFLLLMGKYMFSFLLKNNKRTRMDRRTLVLVSFFLSAYVIWQYMFSYQRYAMTLELLVPVFILITLVISFGRFAQKTFVVCGLILAFSTQWGDWGRLGLTDRPFYEVVDSSVREKLKDAVILVIGPLAYIAASLDQPGSLWLSAPFSERDNQLAVQKIEAKKSAPVYVMMDNPMHLKSADNIMKNYGLPSVDQCSCFGTSRDKKLLLCFPLQAVGSGQSVNVNMCSPFQIPRSWEGFCTPETGATWTQGRQTKMLFKVKQPVKSDIVFIINGIAFLSDTHRQRLNVTANGHVISSMVLSNESCSPGPITIPRAVLGDGNSLELLLEMPDAISPRELLHEGDDERLLGIAIKSVSLHPSEIISKQH